MPAQLSTTAKMAFILVDDAVPIKKGMKMRVKVVVGDNSQTVEGNMVLWDDNTRNEMAGISKNTVFVGRNVWRSSDGECFTVLS